MTMEIAASFDEALLSPLEVTGSSKRQVPPKRSYLCTSLKVVQPQKTVSSETQNVSYAETYKLRTKLVQECAMTSFMLMTAVLRVGLVCHLYRHV
jgi:hypothetical protein